MLPETPVGVDTAGSTLETVQIDAGRSVGWVIDRLMPVGQVGAATVVDAHRVAVSVRGRATSDAMLSH